MRNVSVLIFLLAAACIVGCAGGGTNAPGLPAASSGARAGATFTLTIPASSGTSSAARTPAFVSPNVQSIAVAIAGTASAATTANLGAASPNCSAATNGSLTCTVAVAAPVGNDTFTVTLYSGTNASGSVLSTATVSGTVTAGGTNAIPITMNGIVASITVNVTNGNNLIPGGYATTLPVVVAAKDASGATIVGPGNYAAPITLTNADTSGVTVLSTTNVTAPSTVVTLAYVPNDANTGVLNVSGLPFGSTRISAAASGVAAAAVVPGTFAYIADRFAGYSLPRTLTGTGSVTITTYNARGTPSPSPSTYAYTISNVETTHSGTTYNGVATNDSHHVTTYVQTSPATSAPSEVLTEDDYRANTLTPSGAIYYTYGMTQADVNGSGVTSPITGNLPGEVDIAFTYPVAGAWQDDVLPHATASWSNNGIPFTEQFSNAESATFTVNADGSTTFNESAPSVIQLAQAVSGASSNLTSGVTTTIGVPVAASPPATGNVIPIVQQTTQPSPGPTALSTPLDWYPGSAAPGQPPYAWTYTEALVPIPAGCNVPSSIATQAYAITNAQAATRIPNFQERTRTQVDYYAPSGIGWLCETYTETASNYRFTTGVISSSTVTTWTFGIATTGALGLVRRR